MDRRTMLIRGSAGMVGLGKPAPSRFPYPGRPESAPGLGAAGGQIIRARKVIVVGANGGIFVYSPAIELGALTETVGIAVAGADNAGNNYLQGDTTYSGGVPGSSHATEAEQHFNGLTSWYFWSGSAWNQIDRIGVASTSGNLLIQSVINNGNIILQCLNGNGGIDLLSPLLANGGSPSIPSVISTDSWHTPALANGWADAAGNVPFRYQLVASPPNGIWMQGTLAAAAAVSNQFFTMPAGYFNSSFNQHIGCGATGGQIAGSVPFVQVDTAGNCTMQHATIGAADTYVFTGCIFTN